MKYLVALGFGLFLIWLLWSGHTEPLILGLGAVSVLLVVWLIARMEMGRDVARILSIPFRALPYFPWLFKEITKANLDVARRILSPKMPIAPRIIKVHASQTTSVGRVLYANSITLTPGTVSINVQGDEITVHALTPEAAGDLQTGQMDKRAKRVEGSL